MTGTRPDEGGRLEGGVSEGAEAEAEADGGGPPARADAPSIHSCAPLRPSASHTPAEASTSAPASAREASREAARENRSEVEEGGGGGAVEEGTEDS